VNGWSPTQEGDSPADSESAESHTAGLTRRLTLNLRGEPSLVVSKPFTAIFPYPMLLLNLGFDRIENVLKDHRLYLGWARGPCLALASKKVFRAQRHVSILAGMRGCRVWGQAHRLLPQA